MAKKEYFDGKTAWFFKMMGCIPVDRSKKDDNATSKALEAVSYTHLDVYKRQPEYFTLGELQQVYEVILNKKLLEPAFRRIIASKV